MKSNFFTLLLIILLMAGLAFVLLGCQTGSSVTIWDTKNMMGDSNIPVDSNISLVSKINKPITEIKGKAAEIYVQTQADNNKSKQAVMNETFKYSGILFLFLMIAMVGGIMFSAFTRSRYGWITSASCAVSIATMEFFIQSAVWINIAIAAGVVFIVITLITWKAIEYHKERDLERAKNVATS